MKKTFTLIILFITFTLLITAASYRYVSGNTFTIPSDNQENNSYHTYKIDKNTKKPQNNKSNNIQKSSNQNNNTDNSLKSKHYDNKENSPVNINANKPPKNYTKNTNIKNTNNINSTNKKNPPGKRIPEKYNHKRHNTKNHNTDIITKIEFKKHFIKIKAGSSEDILFTVTPAKASHASLIYKSNNNSVAVYKNNKLTGIKKGFTTIIIMLKNGTVKAACPVKVI